MFKLKGEKPFDLFKNLLLGFHCFLIRGGLGIGGGIANPKLAGASSFSTVNETVSRFLSEMKASGV